MAWPHYAVGWEESQIRIARGLPQAQGRERSWTQGDIKKARERRNEAKLLTKYKIGLQYCQRIEKSRNAKLHHFVASKKADAQLQEQLSSVNSAEDLLKAVLPKEKKRGNKPSPTNSQPDSSPHPASYKAYRRQREA